MITAGVLLAVFAALIAGVVGMDRNSKQLRQLKQQNLEMRTRLLEIESIARDSHDVDPIFADVILAEVQKFHRRELER